MSAHSETCGCADCVTYYSAGGQTEPCGWPMSVRWSLDDCIAHAEYDAAEYGGPEAGTYCSEQMDALVARIEGKRFNSADELVRYLRQVTGSRDFD